MVIPPQIMDLQERSDGTDAWLGDRRPHFLNTCPIVQTRAYQPKPITQNGGVILSRVQAKG
jgi:hypothetical protein